MSRSPAGLALVAALAISLHAQAPPDPPAAKLAINLVGSAEVFGKRLRLTPALPQLAGAAWFTDKQPVSAGFEMKFQFQLTAQGGLGPGADGFAFVLQNQGNDAIAGRGSAGGFAIGDGRHDWSVPGIPRSIAVFFDTYRNGDGDDPSDNYVALCTNGQMANMHWPPRRLAVGRKLRVRLKDGHPHLARIVYKPPLLSVYLDDGEPEFRAPVDLSTVVDASGSAWLGFTASTGNGFQNHDILGYLFTPARPAVSSDISVVQSEIQFLPSNCLPGRNLCTPREAIVEEKGPGRFSVVLPAHLTWGASIPNPLGRPISITDSRGMVCFDLTGAGAFECSGPGGLEAGQFDPRHQAAFLSPESTPGALIAETRDGRTRLSVNVRKGKASRENQGFFDFDVRVQ